MLKTHECDYYKCNKMIKITRSKRGIPDCPKSQKEIDDTKYCSRSCYFLSNEGKKYNVKTKKIRTVTAEPDFINQFGLRARQ